MTFWGCRRGRGPGRELLHLGPRHIPLRTKRASGSSEMVEGTSQGHPPPSTVETNSSVTILFGQPIGGGGESIGPMNNPQAPDGGGLALGPAPGGRPGEGGRRTGGGEGNGRWGGGRRDERRRGKGGDGWTGGGTSDGDDKTSEGTDLLEDDGAEAAALEGAGHEDPEGPPAHHRVVPAEAERGGHTGVHVHEDGFRGPVVL